jgi:MFS family permease
MALRAAIFGTFMGPVVDRYGRRCVRTPPLFVLFYISSYLAAATAAEGISASSAEAFVPPPHSLYHLYHL